MEPSLGRRRPVHKEAPGRSGGPLPDPPAASPQGGVVPASAAANFTVTNARTGLSPRRS
jgi:hypothetical protein